MRSAAIAKRLPARYRQEADAAFAHADATLPGQRNDQPLQGGGA
jgi:hypothetical protein